MILLDANLLLEMLLDGRANRFAVLEWLERNDLPYCISMLSVHLVLHFGAKDRISQLILKNFLADYPKQALLPEDYVQALELVRGRDYEDALQLAVALRTGCSTIATLDKQFAKTYADKIAFVVVK